MTTASPALSPRPLPIPPLPAPTVPPRQPVPSFPPIGGRSGLRGRLRQLLGYSPRVPALLLLAVATALALGPAWADPRTPESAPPVGRTGCPAEGGENHP